MKLKFLAAFLVTTLCIPAAFAAAPPEPVGRQITQKFTTSLTVGNSYSFYFALYDATDPANQVKVWEEGPVKYKVASGKTITHQLGKINGFSGDGVFPAVDFTKLLYAEAAVRGTTTKAWRVALKAVPFAHGAAYAAAAAGLRMVPGHESPNLIGGHAENSVPDNASGSVIVGGGNASSGDPANSGPNTATGVYAFIGSGISNTADDMSVVGGGQYNRAARLFTVILGGENNLASGEYSSVLGGQGNVASGHHAVVVGGDVNQATSDRATVGGGSGNSAQGSHSTVAGGCSNTASGDRSFAAGEDANASRAGMFVWSATDIGAAVYEDDGMFPPVTLEGGGANTLLADEQFWVKSPGGVFFVVGQDGTTGDPIGVKLVDGSGWQPIVGSPSDVNLKTAVEDVDGRALLEKVAALPVRTWSYKGDRKATRHIGPMAQDFASAFGVGEDDRHINPIDSAGVSLAAIQGLYRLVLELQQRVADQERELAARRDESAAQAARLEQLQRRYAELRTLLAGQPRHGSEIAGR